MKKMRLLTLAVVCSLFSAGCPIYTDPPNTEPRTVQEEEQKDLFWWYNDDHGGADSVYVSYASQTEESSADAGVFVDFDCAEGDRLEVTFDGMGRGDFEYRAAVRAAIEIDGERHDIPGAQKILAPPGGTDNPVDNIIPFSLSGVFEVPKSGTCRAVLFGKSFVGELELFGAASFIIERYR